MRKRLLHSYAARLAFLIVAIPLALGIFYIRTTASKLVDLFHSTS